MVQLLRVAGAIGAITRLFSYAFLVPTLIALFYETPDVAIGPWKAPANMLVFLACFLGTWLLGSLMHFFGPDEAQANLREREAYVTVGIAWLFLCTLAMIPFMVSRVLTSPADAFFEAMSGFTTTGATVIAQELETVPESVMIWRSFLQFLGGMGIIVLSVALLARLTNGGLQLLQAEAPGPTVVRIAPRLAHTARILWAVYVAFAAILFVIMMLVLLRHDMGFKVTVYESLVHTLTTIATGGFSSHHASIAYFDDWLLEVVIIVFVLISGTNYTLTYHFLTGRRMPLLRDPEWRFFLGMFAVVTLVITAILWRGGTEPVTALRGAAFTVASLITSTGYATVDYAQWPAAAQFLILLIMFTGATAGSTSGGIKHVRILLLFKMGLREVRRIAHPRAVLPIRIGGTIVKPRTVTAVFTFFLAFVAIWAIGTLFLLVTDPLFSNPIDAASASVAAVANMGPGLGVVGPAENYAAIATSSKIMLAFQMWFGRLEVFAALMVFLPETWKH